LGGINFFLIIFIACSECDYAIQSFEVAPGFASLAMTGKLI
jgi:hypothetical protein